MKQIDNTTKKPQAPRIKMDGKKIIVGHDDPVNGCQNMMASLGTASPEFLEMVLSQIAETLSQSGKIDQNQVNATLAVITGVQPKDELETMLATQMVAIHNATMTLARRLVHVSHHLTQARLTGLTKWLTQKGCVNTAANTTRQSQALKPLPDHFAACHTLSSSPVRSRSEWLRRRQHNHAVKCWQQRSKLVRITGSESRR